MKEGGGKEDLRLLSEEVRSWFLSRFGSPTPIQRLALSPLLRGESALLLGPTGSGKTLAAFLPIFDDLVRLHRKGGIPDSVHTIYISPLKALASSALRSIREGLEGIGKEISSQGGPWNVRTLLRTGDTPPTERRRSSKTPPHILLTTPETLSILLSTPRFRPHLHNVQFVVVDEVHTFFGTKRGAHLSLSLERLEEGIEENGGLPLQRIGLSATVARPSSVASFLSGVGRACTIVESKEERPIEWEVRLPVPDLESATSEEIQSGLENLLDDLVSKNRTTLVFTNSRSASERVIRFLRSRFSTKYATLDEEPLERALVASHHGSLSRDLREEIEEKLVRGELRCVAASSSLELGIDVGTIDLVVLLGSPRSALRGLQRVGRSGHRPEAPARGVLVPLDWDDLGEALVVVRRAIEGRWEETREIEGPLDVLYQHIIGSLVLGCIQEKEFFSLVQRAWPYRNLTWEEFDSILDLVECQSPRYSAIGWKGRARREGGILKPVGNLLALYSQNVGTIIEESYYFVFNNKTFIGKISPTFLDRMAPGSAIALGGTIWRVESIRGRVVFVTPARTEEGIVPSWTSEEIPLAKEVVEEVAELRERGVEGEDILDFLRLNYGNYVTKEAISNIARYFALQFQSGVRPDRRSLFIEEFPSDEGARVYALHLPFGRRVNEGVGLVLKKRGEKGGVKMGLRCGDWAVLLFPPRSYRLTPSKVRALFLSDPIEDLKESIERSEIFRRRLLRVMRRFLLFPRSEESSRRERWILSRALQTLKDPPSPLFQEAWNETVHEVLDLQGIGRLFEEVQTGKRKIRFVRTQAPSPFLHTLLARFGEGGPLGKERRDSLLELSSRFRDYVEFRRMGGGNRRVL